jgi:hypothetical protein
MPRSAYNQAPKMEAVARCPRPTNPEIGLPLGLGLRASQPARWCSLCARCPPFSEFCNHQRWASFATTCAVHPVYSKGHVSSERSKSAVLSCRGECSGERDRSVMDANSRVRTRRPPPAHSAAPATHGIAGSRRPTRRRRLLTVSPAPAGPLAAALAGPHPEPSYGTRCSLVGTVVDVALSRKRSVSSIIRR